MRNFTSSLRALWKSDSTIYEAPFMRGVRGWVPGINDQEGYSPQFVWQG